MKTIGCVLTCYKRVNNIMPQLQAVRAQTVKPAQLLLWHNAGGGTLDPKLLQGVTYVQAAPNMGVWPRFLVGMELTTDYVCVFDDDTIPGTRWFENCLKTMQSHRGLLGTVGVIFKGPVRSQGMSRVGWPTPNINVCEADIVGHSWFFEREWLRYYALEPRKGGPTFGEDYHFSVALQKHLKLGTYVPPHPPQDMSLWGSIKGRTLGTDAVALYREKGAGDDKARAHAAYVAAGWKPLYTRGNK